MNYYELTFDDRDEEGWSISIPYELADGSWRDLWSFSRGVRLDNPYRLNAKISEPGHARDFNFADFNVPIISTRMGEILTRYADDCVQLIPISVESDQNWFILNVTSKVDCIDYSRSILQFYPTTTDHPDFVPDMAGKIRSVFKISFRKELLSGHSIFRVANWNLPIFISEELGGALKLAGITGMQLQAVS